MEVVMEAFLAFFAAVGATTLVWLAAGLILERISAPTGCMIVLLPVAGGGETLENTVAALLRVRIGGRGFDRILIADCGLSEQGRAAAMCLTRRGAATLCTLAQREEE